MIKSPLRTATAGVRTQEQKGGNKSGQARITLFLNSSLYAYKGVAQHEFKNLLTAASVVRISTETFKNVYPYERM